MSLQKQLLAKRGAEGYGLRENEVEKLVKLLSNYKTKTVIDPFRYSVQFKILMSSSKIKKNVQPLPPQTHARSRGLFTNVLFTNVLYNRFINIFMTS